MKSTWWDGTHFIESGGWYLIGVNPKRSAMYSSLSTVELALNSTKSIAKVGTSAIMMRRRALATLTSVSDKMNRSSCAFMSMILTLGNLWWGIVQLMSAYAGLVQYVMSYNANIQLQWQHSKGQERWNADNEDKVDDEIHIHKKKGEIGGFVWPPVSSHDSTGSLNTEQVVLVIYLALFSSK